MPLMDCASAMCGRTASSRTSITTGPDFPELLEWPFLWQQTEYVLGGGTTDYLLLVLAADHLLNAR